MANRYGKKANVFFTIFWWVAAIAWIGVIFYFSGQTGEESGELSGALTEFLMKVFRYVNVSKETFEFVLRKLAHFGIFAIEGFLLRCAFYCAHPRFLINNITCSILCGIMAVANEYHESFVDGRVCSTVDMGIDFGGALAGILVASLICWIFESAYVRRKYRKMTGPKHAKKHARG